MIPFSLASYRAFVVWVLAAYAAVLSVGAGQAQRVVASQHSEAFAQDGRLQVATLGGADEKEAPADPEVERLAAVCAYFRLPAYVGTSFAISLPTPARGGASFNAPAPQARGPPRYS